MTPDAFEALLRDAVREHPSDVPADLGWDDYARRMGLESSPRPGRGLRRLVAALRRSVSLAATPAFAAVAMLVIGVQAAWIAAQKTGADAEAPPYATHRSTAPAGPVLEVRFSRLATEYELRKLLLEIDGHLVDGPSQLGDYRISVSADRLETARQVLAHSPWVTQVGVVAERGCCKP